MATSREFFEFIAEQLSALDGVSFRPMMGEYIVYCRGKVVGGIYDDRLLVKPTDSAKKLMPDANYEIPYDGAKPMLAVPDVDDKDFLAELLSAIAAELPEPKKKSLNK